MLIFYKKNALALKYTNFIERIVKMRKIKTFAAALILAVCMAFNPSPVMAQDLYNVIYSNVFDKNGDNVQADWITNAILYASSKYGVDPLLIAAVMENESGFYFQASSDAGAVGLMQLMPSTANMIGVNPYNPLDNIIGGTIYLKTQLDNFSSWGEYAVTDAVAAYNAGPNAVINYQGVPPYAETQNYVINVANTYNRLLRQVQY